MGILNFDRSLGNLTCKGTQKLIDYEPYEFSQHCIGILSPNPLAVGNFVFLESLRSGLLNFRVAAKQRQGDLFRYRLVLDTQESLENILDIDPRSGKLKYEREGNRLQYARFSIEPQIYVYTKTFGSADHYVLKGVDVSKSGILLCAPVVYGTIPFIEHTLLEVKLNLGNHFISESVEPLGKVVRIYSEGYGHKRVKYLGVKFVEFESQDLAVWNKALENIEKSFIESDSSHIAA